MDRTRPLPSAVASAAGVALLLAACGAGPGDAGGAGGSGGERIERTEWATSAPPESDQLELLVFAGHSSCIDFENVDVDEDEDRVHIDALVRSTGDEACTDDFVVEEVTVALDAPLGDRPLVGCADEDLDWRGWNRPSDVDCREPVEGW